MNKKVIVIVGILLLTLTSLRLAWFFHYTTSDYPNVQGGVLDLRNIALSLDGEWEFYKGQWINPKNTEEQLVNFM